MFATASKRKASPDLTLPPASARRRGVLRRVLSSPSLTGSPPPRSPSEPTAQVDTDHSDEAEGTSSSDRAQLIAVYDPGDHTSRCPNCLWEVTSLPGISTGISTGICTGCGRHVRYGRRVRYDANNVSSHDHDMHDGNARDEDVSLGSAALSECSISTRSSAISLRTILSAFEFNCTPGFTFNETPDVMPPAVIALSKLLSKASNGCEAIPQSLRPLLESNPRSRMEDIPHYIWAHEASEVSLDTEMWERVQSIVNLVEDLRNTNAEAAAYHRLVQCILEGTTSEMNSLFVKVVTSSKPNRRHLPHATGHQALPNIQIDLSLEHRIPTRHTDVFAQLPYSLLLLLRRAFSSAWSIGPFSDTSLVLCMAVVRTPFSESPRAEAELQAAVGGACMIADRLEQVDLMLSMKPVLPPLSLRTISFPVITLIVIGDTWYYQIAYRSSRTCCVVLPARLAGECGTHVGTFKLLVFITALRKWCRDVYYQEYTDILQELGATVGWKRPVD